MQYTTRGKLRAYWLGCVVCLGGFMFGYDSGIVGSVLTFKSFINDYHVATAHKTLISSLVVSLQQLGAFVACFFVWPLTEWLGRKKMLILCAFVFCIGAIIETINTHSLSAFYVGRVIAGLGLGGSSVLVTMYSSEMVPKEMRGQIGSFYQWFFTFGILISYWVDYGCLKGIGTKPMQWQVPIGLQLVPAGLLGFGMFTLPESVRWLTKKGRHAEALKALEWTRGGATQDVIEEMEEIRVGVEMEVHATEGFHLKELFMMDNFKRILAGVATFIAQQATGATAFAYFAPQYFSLLVGPGDRTVLLTGIFGVVKVVACGIFVLFLADRVNRRTVLIWGALFMAVCQIVTAIVVKEIPQPKTGMVTNAGRATVALIYLFVMAYNFSWGPLPWPYVSEIFPTRIRSAGVATAVSSQWLFNFIFSLTTPYMITNMGWGTFLLWGLFDVVIAMGTFVFLKETRMYSLEQIAHQKFSRHAAPLDSKDDQLEDATDVRPKT